MKTKKNIALILLTSVLISCSSSSIEVIGTLDHQLFMDDDNKYERIPVITSNNIKYILEFKGASETVTGIEWSTDERFRKTWRKGDDIVYLSLKDKYSITGKISGSRDNYQILSVKTMTLIITESDQKK